MEVKITISDNAGSTTIQIGSGQAARVESQAPEQRSAPSGSDIEAGAAMAGPSPLGQPAITGSVLEPPADVLRAAAAIGALSAGPAPALAAVMMAGAPGEPLPFTAAGLESATMAAAGTPDQTAGAAPGSERSAPVEVIAQTEGE
jgi:hypothetical protein